MLHAHHHRQNFSCKHRQYEGGIELGKVLRKGQLSCWDPCGTDEAFLVPWCVCVSVYIFLMYLTSCLSVRSTVWNLLLTGPATLAVCHYALPLLRCPQRPRTRSLRQHLSRPHREQHDFPSIQCLQPAASPAVPNSSTYLSYFLHVHVYLPGRLQYKGVYLHTDVKP